MQKRFWILASIIVPSFVSAANPPDTPLAPSAAPAATVSSTKDLAAATEAAIDKGIAYLRSVQQENGSWRNCPGTTALALKAVVHTGVPKGCEDCVANAVQYLLKTARYDHTYETALLAMALQEIDAKKYRDVIQKCADYLHESQLPHGMWTYSKVSPEEWKAIQKEFQARAANPKGDPKAKNPPALLGDNSNTQFALLGLRAVRWAGLPVRDDVIKKAQDHFIRTQNADGGWGYREYGSRSWGSMTCAAMGSLCILDSSFRSGWYFERRKIQKSNTTLGIQWMGDNFSVTENPFDEHGHYYYYMYSMERAGIMARHKTFGGHDWYREGAPILCQWQQPDGSWVGTGSGRRSVMSDTAFAILFLRKGLRANRTDLPILDDEHIDANEDKGNNGVGNGLDPAPPGNPPVNDGPDTGPGNPGNKNGADR